VPSQYGWGPRLRAPRNRRAALLPSLLTLLALIQPERIRTANGRKAPAAYNSARCL
jgi:hypothetical protein